MGLNAFFAFTLVAQLGYSWQQALAVVMLSGIIFLIIAISPLRGRIIAAIPNSLKAAISVGIGLFIALIGLFNAGIITANNNLLSLSLAGQPQMLAMIGLAITFTLMLLKVNGAILYGIVVTTIIGLLMGVTSLPEHYVARYKYRPSVLQNGLQSIELWNPSVGNDNTILYFGRYV